MAMKQTSLVSTLTDSGEYEDNTKYVLKMQPIAISQFYSRVWPKSEVVELDNDKADHLKAILDIGGADKMLREPNGAIAFLGQRFRRYKSWHPTPTLIYDDFTIRCRFPGGYDSEMEKLRQAMESGGFIASWYAYGHANQHDTGFVRFRIIRLPLLLRGIYSGQIQSKRRLNKERRPFVYIKFQSIPHPMFLLDYPGYQIPILDEVEVT